MPPRFFVQPRHVRAFVLALAIAAAAVPLRAQRAPGAGPALSVLQTAEPPAKALALDEVIDLAEARSEQIAIAQFGVTRAAAGEQRARSERLPQLSGGASYDRTLRSEFSGVFATDSGGSGDGGAGADFSKLPFGQANAFRLNLAFSQPLYAGGRIDAQQQMAAVGRSVADSSLRSARAQLVLDAT
ncbi:MAG: TolC family protein, partial [Rhodospirillaceae bacterium]